MLRPRSQAIERDPGPGRFLDGEIPETPKACAGASAHRKGPGVRNAFNTFGVVKIMAPFLGTLNIRCRIMIGTQKGAIILTTTHLG